MSKIKLGFLAIAMMGACAAFATKIGDTFSYEDGSGNPLTPTQYAACPNSTGAICGVKIDDQTQQVVETKRYH